VTAQIPIIGMSTQPLRDADADAFLNKPFDPHDLLEAADTLIEQDQRASKVVMW
jgi:DNA-binding response OmpR family regulator